MSLIGDAKAEMECRPFVALDHVLTALVQFAASKTDFSRRDLFALFAEAALRACNLTDLSANPTEQLFSADLGDSARRVIGSCILRLLAANDSCLDHADLRIKAFALLDDVFARDLYRLVEVDPKAQTYVKMSKLRDLTPTVESELRAAASELRTLDGLTAFRQKLMQALNKQRTQAVIGPFLPKSLLGARLEELFLWTTEYLQAPDSSKIAAYRRSYYALDSYIADARAMGTQHAEVVLQVASAVAHLLHIDFEHTTLSKPAVLTVDRSEK
jgi:hypothetical protein